MIRFEDLIEKVRATNADADIELLRRAYVFSAFEHKGHVRHSGEPYLVHPLEVADLLADMNLDVVAVAAGPLHHLPAERRLKIAQETRDIYAPIANRLGMSKLKSELEELAFKYLEAKAYESLRQRVEARRRATEGLIEDLTKTISAKLTEAQ